MPDLSRTSPDAALMTCVMAALTLWAVWCLVAVAIAVVDRRLAARIGPPLLRGLLVAGTCAATAVPARAATAVPARTADSGTGVLDGLRMPQRPAAVTSTPAAAAGTEPADRRVRSTRVVRPGDCLWSIVRERRPEVSDATIAAGVLRWYAANLDVIGPDPDVLHPGQELVAPSAAR